MGTRPARGDDDPVLSDVPESAVPVLRDLIEERFARWDAGQAGADGQRQMPDEPRPGGRAARR